MKQTTPKPRTVTQNSALHAGFTEIANILNSSGRDMRVVLKPTVDIPWTTLTVKEYLYKPILNAYANKKSTTKMTKYEVGQVWDIMMKFLGEHHGVEYLQFPSQGDMIAMAREIKIK